MGKVPVDENGYILPDYKCPWPGRIVLTDHFTGEKYDCDADFNEILTIHPVIIEGESYRDREQDEHANGWKVHCVDSKGGKFHGVTSDQEEMHWARINNEESFRRSPLAALEQ